jgi:hypothetical protein
MAPLRRIAAQLLAGIIRCSSEEGRIWGAAMLREMDFVTDDVSAVRWALGSAGALCRFCLAQKLRALAHRGHRSAAASLRGSSRTMAAMISGMLAAWLVLAACALLLSCLLHASWFDPALRQLADRLLFAVVPETVYLAGIIALWRRRRAMAVGILAAAAILIAHVVIHSVTRA